MRIHGACDAFEVSVEQPRPGDRELHVEVVFIPGGPADAATIELRMYSRRLGWVIRKGKSWEREAAVPDTRARLERGETGRLRFTRPLPAFVSPYRGTGLEFAPVLVTEGDDGSAVRLQLDVPPPPDDAFLVVRGLPRSERLRPSGLRGRLRGGSLEARFEEARRGAVGVTVEAARALTAGRVRLEAVEYARDDGHYFEWQPPILATDVTLTRAGERRLRGELSLPDAGAAPASIECSRAADRQGVRWWARFELEDDRGREIRAQAPLHVGVERDDAAA